MLLTQFIEYIQLYKNFETSYDQILQPQKRLVIRRLLEATMGRMIELKHELVKHQLNYIQFHEPVLKVKQGSPELHRPIPSAFKEFGPLKLIRDPSASSAQTLGLRAIAYCQ